jgi:CTP:molybdopterin cytidylyltransferase MocA
MTTAILLAAGRGERLGRRDKPTLPLNGEPLLSRHVRQARAGGATGFVIVANPDNVTAVHARAEAAADDLPVQVVLQDGPDAHAAALTGLRRLPDGCQEAFLAGITDIVPDDTYARVALSAHAAGEDSIVIATCVLERVFVGGMLSFHPGTHLIKQIIERPPGGCPPGHLANIWIHHLRGADLIRAITRHTAAHGDYETAVNTALAHGTPGRAVVLPWWEAVKDPASLRRAELLPTTSGNAA